MALSPNATKLAQLINPQVMGSLIERDLTKKIKFAPLCTIDNTLTGQPGNTVTLPKFTYIGDATDVAEGEEIPIGQLGTSTETVTISKFGRGIILTDEAILSGYGDPVGEAVNQLTLSIASALDNKVLACLEGITGTMEYKPAAVTTAFTADDVADALVLFGENIEGPKALVISPEFYAVLRKADGWADNTDTGAGVQIEGRVGTFQGCTVSLSDKLKGKNNAYIIKPGAVAIFTKRNTEVEPDRDTLHKATVLTADKHCAVYLMDESKAIKMSLRTE